MLYQRKKISFDKKENFTNVTCKRCPEGHLEFFFFFFEISFSLGMYYTKGKITITTRIHCVAIDQFLFGEFFQFSRFDRIQSFNVADNGKSPTRSARALILDFSYRTLLPPIETLGQIDIRNICEWQRYLVGLFTTQQAGSLFIFVQREVSKFCDPVSVRKEEKIKLITINSLLYNNLCFFYYVAVPISNRFNSLMMCKLCLKSRKRVACSIALSYFLLYFDLNSSNIMETF